MLGISVVKLDHVSTDLDEAGRAAVHFTARRPVRFTAGQHGLWAVPGGGMRPFTIASAPEEDLFTLGTDLSSGSRLKRALGALQPGAAVRFLGPAGDFTLQKTGRSVVMLAQGMGVTPFRSMLLHTMITGAAKRTTLLHVGAPHPFRRDTEEAASEARYLNSRQDFIDEVTAVALTQPDATFMVSGAPAFVRSTVTLLTDRAVGSSQIRRDAFYGYSAGAKNQGSHATP